MSLLTRNWEQPCDRPTQFLCPDSAASSTNPEGGHGRVLEYIILPSHATFASGMHKLPQNGIMNLVGIHQRFKASKEVAPVFHTPFFSTERTRLRLE
jgi:hypothetical protein